MPDRRQIKKQYQANKGKRFSYPSQQFPDELSNTQRKPAFSFEFLQDSHCITVCSQEDQRAFLDTMRNLSQLTWQQIRSTQRHGLGSEKIYRASFTVKIPDYISEDVTFIAIRFSGKKPMVGFQDGRIFHIVWFDKNFTVYKHGK